ncbi:MAG: bifunctional oligoribonuclease/PAP phosphatase NrnA [Raoultibacter sp.]
MITPQTNINLAALAEKMKHVDSFALCGHVSPDGDCIGSQLALAHALRAMGKEVVCLLAKPDPIEANLLFLPGAKDMVCAADFVDTPQAFVALDVPSRERLGLGAAVQARCPLTITIDHHANENAMSQFSYVDPASPSTTMLVWELVHHLDVALTPEVATCAYTGLVTDTGRFQFQNTTQNAFIAASEMVAAGADPSDVSREIFQNRSFASVMLLRRAMDHVAFDRESGFIFSYLTQDDFRECEAVKSDAEPLIDELRSLEGVRVASILRDQGSEVRGSLRAKDNTDVAAIAARFGGGGHKAAAGFTFAGPLPEAISALKAAVVDSMVDSNTAVAVSNTSKSLKR